MKKFKITYRDMTGDPRAETKANHAPELRDALVNCGFKRVGLLERLAPGVLTRGQVEILTSPDRRALAIVDQYIGGPVISLRSITEDSIVVETTMKPKRRAQVPDTVLGLPKDGDFAIRAVIKLMQMVVGEPPLWTRQDRPRAGYHVDLVDTDKAKVLWQRHQQRIAAIFQTGSTGIRPQDSIPLYVGINHRFHQILKYEAKWQKYFNNTVVALVLLSLPLMLILTYVYGDVLKEYSSMLPVGEYKYIILLPILPVLAIAVLGLLLIGLFKRVIIPRLPGPKLHTVSDLLDAVQREHGL